MNRRHRKSGNPGFSLIEIIVVVGILSVLAGLLYASTGGVREKSRQSVCVSNLRQIGIAVAMYRQDYGGTDTPGQPAEMGLPPSDYTLMKASRPSGGTYLGGSDGILFCPSFRRAEHPKSAGSYGWIPWVPSAQRSISSLPPFPAEVARRGSDFPLAYCKQHDFPPEDRVQKTWFVIVLRIDGRVTSSHETTVNSWEW